MDKIEKIFVDTNVLLKDNFDFNNYKKVYISIVSIEELDGLKKDEKVGYQARRAIKNIESAINAGVVEVKFNYSYFIPEIRFLEHKNDNIILQMACEIYNIDNKILFLSDDYNLIIKAKMLNLPCSMFEFGESKNEDEIYKGYAEINLTSDEINQLYNDLDNNINTYNLIENQYVIINEKGKRKPQEFRYSKSKLESLKLPDSKYIKAVNSQQRCALDLLNNKNIPIKIIAGGYGSGKTYLTTKMGLYHVFEKGNYGNLLLLRNPLGSGEEIGYLRGDKEDKIYDFFRCIEQYIEPNMIKDKNINEYIKKDVTYYIKGMSYGSTFVFVDEAEDMNLKILKLIGSRIESDSCVVFCGDYNQSEDKYKYNNGLLQLINSVKGNPLVGIVVLNEDVRSDASKVFAYI